MMGATPDGSYATQPGSHAVRVGILDTGIQGDHPDIAPNFNAALSRNFTTDDPLVDGACADDPDGSCSDPANVDEDGHGTHVAGTVASPLNGIGMAGVAPGVELVNLRAGQDSGYFFLQPSVDALTYAGDHGIDVVNMSYYIDPWLYNCAANPADSPAEQAEQRTIIAATQRALDYARARGVTLISARRATSTPTSASRRSTTRAPTIRRGTEHERDIDNSCLTMPTEGEGVARRHLGRPDRAQGLLLQLRRRAEHGRGAGRRPPRVLRHVEVRRAGDPDPRAVPQPRAGREPDANLDGEPDIDPGPASRRSRPSCASAPHYWQWIQGTSMASPHAVGVAALIVAQFGRPDPRQRRPHARARGGRARPARDGGRPRLPGAAAVPLRRPGARPRVRRLLRGRRGVQRVLRRRHRQRGPRRQLQRVRAPAAPPPSGGQLGATFQARVLPRRITLTTRVRRAGRGLRLRISGRLTPPAGMSAKEACGSGVFTVLVQSRRKKTLAVRETRLRASCAYGVTVRFARRTGLSRALRVRVVFRGNDRLKQRRAPLASRAVPRR